MTNLEIQAFLSECLTSNSYFPLQVHLKALIDRGDHGFGTERYRVKFMDTDVVSMAELTSAITTDTFVVSPVLSSGSKELTVSIYFDNIVVNFDYTYPSDNDYAATVSHGQFNLGMEVSFVPGYTDFFELRVIRHIFKSVPYMSLI